MADFRRIGGAAGRLVLRGVQIGLAAVVLLSLWALGQLPKGPNVPEQAGTFIWAFLFSWAFALFFLLLFVGGQLLVGGYRTWSAVGDASLRQSLRRLAFDSLLGVAVGVGIPLLTPRYRISILVPSAVVAWTVLIHHFGEAVRYGREQLEAP